MAIVGSAYVEIHAVTKSVADEIRDGLMKAMQGQGAKSGKTYGDEFGDSSSTQITQATEKVTQKVSKEWAAAGADAGKGFSDKFTNLTNKLSRAVVAPSVDTTRVENDIARVEQRLESLRKIKANPTIDLEIAAAEAKLKSYQQRLDELKRKPTSTSVQADIAAAESSIAQVTARLARLNNEKTNPKVDADIADAELRLGSLTRKLEDLQNRPTKVRVETDDKTFTDTFNAISLLGRNLASLTVPAAIVGLAPQILSLGNAAITAAGSLYLLPAATGAAALGVGTLATGFAHLGDALGPTGTPAQIKKVNEAMAALPPNARAIVTELRAQGDAWSALRIDVQTHMFAGLAAEIKPLAGTYLPMLRSSMVTIADGFNSATKEIVAFLKSREQINELRVGMSNVSAATADLFKLLAPLTKAFFELFAVGSQFLPDLVDKLTIVVEKWTDWVAAASDSGEMFSIIEEGLSTVGALGDIIGNSGGIIKSVFDAATESGADMMGVTGRLTEVVDDFLNTGEGNAALVAIFTAINDVVAALTPALIAVAGAISQGLIALGPQLGPLAQAFADMAISLAPLITDLAKMAAVILPPLAAVLQTIAPLLGPIVAGFLAMYAINALVGMYTALTASMVAFAIAQGTSNAAMLAGAGLITATRAALTGYIIAQGGAVVAAGAGTGALSLLSLGFRALGLAIMANPIGIIVTVLAGVVAAVIYAYNHFEGFRNVVDTVFSAIIGFIQPVLDFFTGPFVDTIVGAFNAVVNFFSGLPASISSVVNAVIGWFTGPFVNGIVGAFNTVVAWVTGLPAMIMNGLSALGSAIASGAATAWNWLVSTAIEAGLALQDYLANLPKNIAYALGFLVGAMVAAVVAAFTEWKNAISNGIDATITFFREMPPKVGAALVGFGTMLVDEAIRSGTEFKDAVVTGFNATVDWFKALPGVIGDALTNFGTLLVDEAVRSGTEFKDAIVNGFNATVDWFKSLPGIVGAALVGFGTMLVAEAVRSGVEFKDAIVNGFNATIEFFRGLPAQIGAFFSSAGEWLKTAGQNILDGLINGLKAAGSAIGDFFISLVDGFVQGFKDALGIASPSTLFMSFGQFIIQGLIDGITAMASFVITAVATLALNLYNSFVAGLQVLLSYWTSFWTSFVAFFEPIITGISTIWTNIWTGIQTVITTVLAFISSFIQMQITGWQVIWQTTLTVIQTIWDTVWGAIQTAISAILGWISAFIQAQITGWQIIWQTTLMVIQTAWTTIWTAIQTFITMVLTAIQTLFTTVLTIIQTLWTTVWTAVQLLFTTVWTAIQTVATTIWNAISAFLTAGLNAFQALWTTIWTAIQTAFTAIMTAIQTVATTIWNAIVAFFTAGLNAFSQTWTTVWTAIRTAFETVWNTIRTVATTIWNAISTFFTQGLNAFKTTWESMWTSIRTSFENVFGGIKSIAEKIWTDVKGIFSRGINAVIGGVNWPIEKINGLFGISIPTLPQVQLATGGDAASSLAGRVSGLPGRTADRVPALLSAEEHVWSGKEVMGVGGHEGVRRLRQMAREGTLEGFAEGGMVKSTEIPKFSPGAFIIDPKVADVSQNFLHALNAGQAEAVQATGGRYATGPTKHALGGHIQLPGFAAGGAIANAQRVAAAMNGAPYVWGGASASGADCSGYQSIITNALRMDPNPYKRVGSTANFPWGGFQSGMGTYTVGAFKGNPGHMAGTLAGVNVESGGSPSRVKYGAGAVGADSSQFTTRAFLPEIGGVFVPGGGGAVFDPAAFFDALVATIGLPESGRQVVRDLVPDVPSFMDDIGVGLYDKGWSGLRETAIKAITSVMTLGGLLGSGPAASGGGVQAQVQAVAAARGWGSGPEWDALSQIIQKESGWDPNAANPSSSARGLFQKMTSLHGPVEGTAAGQAEWGINYIASRYGTPSAALAHWNSVGSYDRGGWLKPGITQAINGTGKPEAIIADPMTTFERSFRNVFKWFAPECREAIENSWRGASDWIRDLIERLSPRERPSTENPLPPVTVPPIIVPAPVVEVPPVVVPDVPVGDIGMSFKDALSQFAPELSFAIQGKSADQIRAFSAEILGNQERMSAISGAMGSTPEALSGILTNLIKSATPPPPPPVVFPPIQVPKPTWLDLQFAKMQDFVAVRTRDTTNADDRIEALPAALERAMYAAVPGLQKAVASSTTDLNKTLHDQADSIYAFLNTLSANDQAKVLTALDGQRRSLDQVMTESHSTSRSSLNNSPSVAVAPGAVQLNINGNADSATIEEINTVLQETLTEWSDEIMRQYEGRT